MCDCGGHSGPNSVAQTLDELEFERGLWFAAQYGDQDRVLYLLNKGHHVDQKDSSGYTALHYAARNGHLDICRLLVEWGACVNAVTAAGQATPLQRAATVGKLEVVKYLIENKADCRLKDGDGKTALHRAAAGGSFDVCEVLLEREPGLKDAVDQRGKRAADYAQTSDLLTLLR